MTTVAGAARPFTSGAYISSAQAPATLERARGRRAHEVRELVAAFAEPRREERRRGRRISRRDRIRHAASTPPSRQCTVAAWTSTRPRQIRRRRAEPAVDGFDAGRQRIGHRDEAPFLRQRRSVSVTRIRSPALNDVAAGLVAVLDELLVAPLDVDALVDGWRRLGRRAAAEPSGVVEAAGAGARDSTRSRTGARRRLADEIRHRELDRLRR